MTTPLQRPLVSLLLIGTATLSGVRSAAAKTDGPKTDGPNGGLISELRRDDDWGPGPMHTPAPNFVGELPDYEVVRVIRTNFFAVRGCYQLAERAASPTSGKAMVSIEIAPNGHVSVVRIDAPTLRESSLPGCLSRSVKNWVFPTFTLGPKRYTYPIVSVGG